MTIGVSKSSEKVSPVVTPLRAWAPALVCIAIAFVVFGLAFQQEILGAMRVWVGSTAYNHCFIVLPLVAVLLWDRRQLLAELRPRPSLWVLAFLPVLIVMWFAAALLDILEVEQLFVVALFQAILLLLFGWTAYRALLAPLLFVFFVVPFGAFLVPTLQHFTAAFTVIGLNLVGIPVFADGFIIQIPEGTFEVAEACAGLRFLIASSVFGCFFAVIVYRSLVRRLIFIALSILLPIVANGLRVLGLIILSHFEGRPTAALADHLLYGWLFFSLVTLLLIGIGMTFAGRPLHSGLPAINTPSAGSPFQFAAAITLGLVIVLVGPTYFLVVERVSAAPLQLSSVAGLADNTWDREPAPAGGDAWRPDAKGAIRQSQDLYRNKNAAVTLFTASYLLPARGSPLTRAMNAMREVDSRHTIATRLASVAVGKELVAVNSATVALHGRYRLIWWLYLIDGQATASTLTARLLQFRAALSGGAHVGTLVAIATETDDPDAASAILARFAKSLRLAGSDE
jgi:exosortase A